MVMYISGLSQVKSGENLTTNSDIAITSFAAHRIKLTTNALLVRRSPRGIDFTAAIRGPSCV